MSERTKLAGPAGLILLASLLTGCASTPSNSMALEGGRSEERKLRAQNMVLTDDVARLQNECDRLAEALQETTRELESREATSTAFPDLEAEGISVDRRGADVVFTIPTSVTFGSGKASVSRAGQEALRILARRLREFTGDAHFHVEGHTDSDPIRSSGFKSNRDLSLQRSMAVVDFLVKECKIADERFVVAGYGPHRPLSPNDGAANKARNRRVELVVRQGQ